MPTLLPDVLQSRAAHEADKAVYRFLNEHGEESASLTYGELHAKALAVAQNLVQHCKPGDRALLIFPPCLDFIVAYFGCLYAQVVAVPVNPPRRNKIQGATRSILQDCEPAAVVTISGMIEATQPSLEQLCGPLHWVAADQLTDAASFEPEPVSADSLAFLQYTSGSTSDPKGVMVSHRSLAANEEMIRRAFGHDENSTVVGWAPFFHDMGLIGNVIQPLYVGASCTLMSPMAFIRRPLLWLSAISRYRAHTSGGPNFAFDACVAHAARGNVPDLDLSSWKVAYNGAEPIRPETVQRFTATFAPYGFSPEALYPCYGLAESTLLVSGSGKGRGPRVVEADAEALSQKRFAEAPSGQGRKLVGSGQVLPGEQLRIVDPETRQECPPERVGEIWVCGDHVTQGYWKRPETTSETFDAEIAGEPGQSYLRTGDLGVLAAGELYVVGRLKDLVIIRGKNYYPQDIEQTAQSAHPALKPSGCAAFSVPGADGEKLVVVHEVKRDHSLSADEDIAGAIRAAIAQEHQISTGDVVLTVAGQLQKTSSGKIMRAAARKRYLEEDFKLWAPAQPAAT